MKKSIFFAVSFITLALKSEAQLGQNTAIYTPYTVGVSVGETVIKGDLPTSTMGNAFKVNFDRNFSPYISIGIEGQYGNIIEGEKTVSESSHSSFYEKGTYRGVNINGKLAAGQFMKGAATCNVLNLIKKIYIGTGVGFLQSNAEEVTRGNSYLLGKTSNNAFYIPTNCGIDIPLITKSTGIPLIQLNMNYQFNFIMSDNFDAFYNPGSAKDAYSLFSAGIKVNFGHARFRF